MFENDAKHINIMNPDFTGSDVCEECETCGGIYLPTKQEISVSL